TGRRRASSALLGGPVRRVDVGGRGVWVAERATAIAPDELVKLDPRDLHTILQIPMPHGIHDVVTGGGAVWVAGRDFPVIEQVDPRTGAIIATFPTAANPQELAYDRGALWASNADDTVTWLNVRTH